jgi:hypothetical protein
MYKDYKNFPESDVLLRGHVHYFYSVQDSRYLMMTCPCMKMLGERFGGRNFDDVIDFGFIVMDIESKNRWSWKPVIAQFEKSIPSVIKL